MSDHNPFPVPVDILPDDDADLKHAAALLQQERERRARVRAAGGRDAYVAKVEAENKVLREAAGALVTELESSLGDWPRHCDAPRCRRLATLSDGDLLACDEHQDGLVAGDIEDLSYAPSLRTLRALLEAKT